MRSKYFAMYDSTQSKRCPETTTTQNAVETSCGQRNGLERVEQHVQIDEKRGVLEQGGFIGALIPLAVSAVGSLFGRLVGKR